MRKTSKIMAFSFLFKCMTKNIYLSTTNLWYLIERPKILQDFLTIFDIDTVITQNATHYHIWCKVGSPGLCYCYGMHWSFCRFLEIEFCWCPLLLPPTHLPWRELWTINFLLLASLVFEFPKLPDAYKYNTCAIQSSYYQCLLVSKKEKL